jgi:response regulator of citrate/malate metabolism
MKERIKAWLKAYNHERDWLAEKLDVKKRTVDNWLSSPQEIPSGKLTLIERLMQDDEAAESARRQKLIPTAQVFSLEVDLPTFRAYCAASLQHGQTLEQWAIDELNAAAESAMQQPKPEAPSPVIPGADTAAA